MDFRILEVESISPNDVTQKRGRNPRWLCGGADLRRWIQRFILGNLSFNGS